jgi:hypothetical protein
MRGLEFRSRDRIVGRRAAGCADKLKSWRKAEHAERGKRIENEEEEELEEEEDALALCATARLGHGGKIPLVLLSSLRL